MIRLRNISKSFFIAKKQTVEVLSDISADIEPGKITGIIGLNGAGKTTLIRIIAELYKPSSGDVLFDFKSQNIVRKTAILSSEQGLYRNLSTKMIIEYFGRLQNEAFNFHSPEVKRLIEILGLEKVLHIKTEILSAGTRQKLLLLLTFINDPEVILLDEPANYLDFLGKKRLDDLMMEFRDKNKYILYATHNLHDIEQKCEKCIF